ncbi:DUF262 domain-containing protein [Chamaesiphon sp. VAR_48_metabat_403]|uniref:DUF262 domain-containing protein n=1 Tax=Chamaesiphon sp. VAR_48_metabat_403 TaxID=2964700 RepID=UPI00286E7348|nr:DUF262 domain-containing protein [Chamaesiphon sp. VAR_48_metabat_403]
MLANESLTENIAEFPEDKFEDEENENLEPEILVNSQTLNRDRRLVTHPYDFIIRSLKEQVDDRTLVLADDFQRRRVWDDTKASRLIESLLINVPIPVCYFAELDDGSYSVIDGQQRLTSIYRYLDNEFPLKSLKVRDDLNKRRFNQLGVADQRLIKSRSIRCVVILKDSDPEIRFDVFDRLNSNSVKLNRQELRNSLYKGTLSNLINKEFSENEIFKKLRRAKEIDGKMQVDKRMNDCEMILRFFAFNFSGYNYTGNLHKFLDDYLHLGQKLNPENIDRHRSIFLKTIDNVYEVFGSNGFRRYDLQTSAWIDSLNRAIYDIVMLYFSRLPIDVVRQKKNEILNAFIQLQQDPEFQQAITVYPEKIQSLQTRLDKWHESLQQIGICVDRVTIGAASGSSER